MVRAVPVAPQEHEGLDGPVVWTGLVHLVHLLQPRGEAVAVVAARALTPLAR